MKILFILLILSTFTCQAQDTSTDARNSTAFNDFYSAIKQHFYHIDSLRNKDYDSLVSANDKLIEFLFSCKDFFLRFPDTLDYDLLYIAKSTDKQFALVSWDTRLGGTMIGFTTMAVYNTPADIEAKMLLDSTNEVQPYTYLHFNEINTVITHDGKKIYLAWGHGQGSTILPWQALQAFAIVNHHLVEPAVFPETSSKIFVEFDLSEFREKQKVPVIRVKNNGHTIKVPVANEEEGFSGKYQTYVFDGKVYNVK